MNTKDVMNATRFQIPRPVVSAPGVMFIVFVAGIDGTENSADCITLGVLIHYFTLVTWMWVGAKLMFQKLIIEFRSISHRYIILISLFCWGKRTITNACRSPFRIGNLFVVKQYEGMNVVFFIVCLQEA